MAIKVGGDVGQQMYEGKRIGISEARWPNPSLLPAAQIKAATSAALAVPSITTAGLLYGPDAGYEPLRKRIAAWLTDFYQPPKSIVSDRICITGGASQNVACILQGFSDPIYTRNVWMASPTYFLAMRIFEDNGFAGRLRSVPEDKEGMSVEYLRLELQKSEKRAETHGNKKPTLKPQRPWNKIYRHIIYAVPTFSNPSSITMSGLRREELVSLAREYDACIITDDVYDQLQWHTGKHATQSSLLSGDQVSESSIEHAQLPRLVDIDRVMAGGAEREEADGFGNVISNGTFSKIVGPGCRTGWAEGTAKFAYGLSQVGSSRSGGAPSQLTATFISKLLESRDLQHHIFQTLQPAYTLRYQMMVEAIEKYLIPLGAKMTLQDRDIGGGYFIWITLPEPLLAEDVAVFAKQHEDLVIAPGHLFAVRGDEKAVDLDRNVRLCFSWEDELKLGEGIERLAHVIEGKLAGQGADRESRIGAQGNSSSVMEQHR